MTEKLLPSLVDEQTMIQAGFNYWERSHILVKNGRLCNVYTGYLEDRDLNLVIVEDVRVQKDGKHRDWYVGIFSGTYLGEEPKYCVDEYTRLLREIMSRKHRIAGRNLEKFISQAIQLSTPGMAG